MKGVDSIFKGSAYLLGAITGVVFMVPLTAGALATGSLSRAAPQAIAIDAFGPDMAPRQAHLVNRAGKGARLDVSPRPASAPAPVATPAATPEAERAIATTQPEPTLPAPSRATRTPKGCLSALGVTKSSLSTEELTVCVADASMIGRG